jgi:hypothetical protein
MNGIIEEEEMEDEGDDNDGDEEEINWITSFNNSDLTWYYCYTNLCCFQEPNYTL